jgi:hypothetical protein
MRRRWLLAAFPVAILTSLMTIVPGPALMAAAAAKPESGFAASPDVGAGTSLSPLTWPGKAAPAAISRPEYLAGPASRTLDDVFNSDSCTTQPDNPDIEITCQAVGFYADSPYVNGLQESSSNGDWDGINVFGSDGPVTEPLGVSCVPQQADIPACVAVGEHFSNPDYTTQLVESGGANGFSPISLGNPKGANWSALSEVSCRTSTFCLLVGAAGTARKTRKGIVYTSHAIAYRWGGDTVHPVSLPIPARARSSELAGVSCPTATNCLAVGNFVDSAGRSLPYSVLWTPAASRLHLANSLGPKAFTVFQDVSCAAVDQCVAIGDTAQRRVTSFAERYSAGSWSVMHPSTGPNTAFFDVSCPVTRYCVAVGSHSSNPLIEAWNGSRWKWEAFPAASRPFTDESLGHVSCITTTLCAAVGYRHDPAVRYSYLTLALGWNGKKWTFQKTMNE